MPLKDPNTAIALVRGLVDAIQCPAFVTSPSNGLVTCNKAAKSIKGKNLSTIQMSDGQIVDISGKQYKVISKKLNHKTDCILFELHDVTDPAERLKFAGALLDKALSGAF
jgi:hypothetical protein